MRSQLENNIPSYDQNNISPPYCSAIFSLHCLGVSVEVLEIWTACFSSILMDLSFGAQSANIIHKKKLSSAQAIYRNHNPVIKRNPQTFLWEGRGHFLLWRCKSTYEWLAKLTFLFMLWYAVNSKEREKIFWYMKHKVCESS